LKCSFPHFSISVGIKKNLNHSISYVPRILRPDNYALDAVFYQSGSSTLGRSMVTSLDFRERSNRCAAELLQKPGFSCFWENVLRLFRYL
jgi:hypothetical protein